MGNDIVNVLKSIMVSMEEINVKKRILISLILDFVLLMFVSAQNLQFPTLCNVQIQANVTYNSNEQMFYYSYTLKNAVANTGNVAVMEVDVSTYPATVDFDTVGLRFENDGLTEGSFRRHFPFLKGKVVPVGFIRKPDTWTAGLSNNLTAAFFTVDESILLGQSLSGFEIMSKGLPSVRRCIVSPFFDFDSLFSYERFPNDEDLPNTDSIQNAVKFYGWTVGATAPPIDFSALGWLDTLVSYATQSRSLGWITTQPTADKYLSYFASAKSQLQANNTAGARATLQTALQDVNVDSSTTVTSEAYALIRYNTEYLLAQLPVPPPGLVVKLVNSTGINLTGGALQYYEGGWKDATNNNDGTFSIDTKLKTISLRMTYAYGSQTKSNIVVGADTVVFQTVNAQVQLQNSQGAQMDTGTVQYYAGAWRSFGTTTSGTASKELLPGSYSFRMTYAFAGKDKQQDIGTNPTVVFQTVNAAVQLQNSQGTLIDQGRVQYYSGAWRDFGVTASGVATKELLPNNYSFRMTYAFASKDKQQDIGTNPTVVFQTVNAAVQLKNSQGNLMDQGTVQYYSGAWRDFGVTTNGIATKELLPNNYSFRMTYEFVSNVKAQDISTNSTVSFSTVLCTVRVKDSQNQPVDGAQASYYSGAWRQIGTTVNGEVTKELLPANLMFRIRHGTIQQDKAQNLSTNSLVEFAVQ